MYFRFIMVTQNVFMISKWLTSTRLGNVPFPSGTPLLQRVRFIRVFYATVINCSVKSWYTSLYVPVNMFMGDAALLDLPILDCISDLYTI